MRSLRLFSLSPIVSLLLVGPGMAQERPSSNQFQWEFVDPALGASIPTCKPLAIRVLPFDPAVKTFGIPPYYMISLAIDSTPVTTPIGTDNRTLSWTVTQPAGSEVLLHVVDSTGSTGGTHTVSTIVAGDTTECVRTPAITPEFTVTSNVTGDLQTCQPWGLTIKGGVAPYNLSIAAAESPSITNVTLEAGFDTFTYINRASPGGQLIAAISDSTGRWATGTPLVNTKGSSDFDCGGLASSSSNSGGSKASGTTGAKSTQSGTAQASKTSESAAAATSKGSGASSMGVSPLLPLAGLALAAIGFAL